MQENYGKIGREKEEKSDKFSIFRAENGNVELLQKNAKEKDFMEYREKKG